ncbi:hypothetical protein [Nonomuraea sp. NPDC046570]|uniref:hypothetical protein n=1 Tax=Nonomuraea sp. NPDC046570 TaxID=3155255 RepID=UPI0033F1C6C6
MLTGAGACEADLRTLLDTRLRWVERLTGLPDWPVPAARIALRAGDAELAWQLARWADEYAERNPDIARGMAARKRPMPGQVRAMERRPWRTAGGRRGGT